MEVLRWSSLENCRASHGKAKAPLWIARGEYRDVLDLGFSMGWMHWGKLEGRGVLEHRADRGTEGGE